MSSNPYESVPIDPRTRSVRLIQLNKDGGSECISCSLASVTEPQETEFIALSYCWGSEENPQVIKVNGKPFTVRENLWTFLNQLSTSGNFQQKFWIDALCINQENIVERNHQVAQMKEIYSQAKEVRVWLGPGNPTTWKAMKTLRKADVNTLTRALQTSRLVFRFLRSWDRFRSDPASGISDLLTDEYWHRLWVVQEFVLAKDVTLQVGAETSDWKPLSEFLLSLGLRSQGVIVDQVGDTTTIGSSIVYRFPETSIWPQFKQASRIVDARRAWLSAPVKAFSFVDIMRLGYKRRCSDPRDRIYGLCGLLSDADTVRPDYALSTVELVEGLARRFGLVQPDQTRLEACTSSGLLALRLGEVMGLEFHESLSVAFHGRGRRTGFAKWLTRVVPQGSLRVNDLVRRSLYT